MTDDHGMELPGTSLLVRPMVLAALVEDLGAAEAAAFVERFVRLWPQRRERLHVAIRRRDAEQLWDAAHSLTSSASMAGADLLADASSQLHAAVPASGHPPSVGAGGGAGRRYRPPRCRFGGGGVGDRGKTLPRHGLPCRGSGPAGEPRPRPRRARLVPLRGTT